MLCKYANTLLFGDVIFDIVVIAMSSNFLLAQCLLLHITFTFFNVYGCESPHIGLCTTCMPGVHGGQKRPLDLLQPEFQRVMSCHMGSGSRIVAQPLSRHF